MADCEKSSAESVDLDETLPLPGAMVSKREFKLKLKNYRDANRRRISLAYKRLNQCTRKGKQLCSRHLFRPSTNMPEIDLTYIAKSGMLLKDQEGKKDRHFIAVSWDFCYPPNAKSREHCARIIYDALGQPDQICMKKTNSGYEVCEVFWHQKEMDEIPECFNNWDLLGRVEIALPNYIDTTNGDVQFEDTYNASFKLIDRHYEIFTTKDWRRTPGNMIYSLKEVEEMHKRDENQPPIDFGTRMMESCRTLYTFIWNNDPADANAANLLEAPAITPNATLGVCHGDHWHIQFFTSTKNAARKLDYILQSLLGQLGKMDKLAGMTVKCSITKQLVRNPNFLTERQYLPSTSALGDCSNPTTLKRMRMREEEDMRKRGRYARERSLFDLFESMNINSEEQFLEWLHADPVQLADIWAKYPNWEKKLQQYVMIKFKVKKGIYDEPYTKLPYLEMVAAHVCADSQHDPNPEDGAIYLYSIFQGNEINFGDFLQEVDNIIRHKYPRINALVLRGPTSTGKTLIAKNIVKPYNFGTVSRDGDATAFYLQNLLEHDVALMEEPHISMTTVQNFKELFAGSPLVIQVKNRAPQELKRIPCIVTTNQALTDNLIDSEAEPIKRRIIEYRLYKPIT
ncbi:hypothetical protein ACTXT7_017438, partial [Hymenolepis weldensis]